MMQESVGVWQQKQEDKMSEVEKYIKSIPDFPQPGIIFRDVTSVTEDPEGMKLAIDEMDKLLDLSLIHI